MKKSRLWELINLNDFLFFQSEKELLWDSIKADLEEKIHKLEEDKNNVDFSTGLWEQTSRLVLG